MNYKEYGSENKEVIMFLHGGGLSLWRSCRSGRASALKMQSVKPGTSLDILPGLHHGEFSINHADDYVREVELILNGVK